MEIMLEKTKERDFSESLAFKIRTIIRKENSFILGFSEVISNNLDFVFRYLYAGAYLLMIAAEFID